MGNDLSWCGIRKGEFVCLALDQGSAVTAPHTIMSLHYICHSVLRGSTYSLVDRCILSSKQPFSKVNTASQ